MRREEKKEIFFFQLLQVSCKLQVSALQKETKTGSVTPPIAKRTPPDGERASERGIRTPFLFLFFFLFFFFFFFFSRRE